VKATIRRRILETRKKGRTAAVVSFWPGYSTTGARKDLHLYLDLFQPLELTLLILLCSFKAARTYSPIHTGGAAVLSGDGSWLLSTLNEQALVTDIETGNPVQELKGVS